VAVFAKLRRKFRGCFKYTLKGIAYLGVDLCEMLFFDGLRENSSDNLFQSIVGVGLDICDELLCKLRLLFGSDLVQNCLRLDRCFQKVFIVI